MSNHDIINLDDYSLILAAEECDPATFNKIHTFSSYEKKIIRSLMAHGPVLVRGGRGSGKSALLIEASRQLEGSQSAVGIYLSLRYLPLLRSYGEKYEEIFCKLVYDIALKTITPSLSSIPKDAGALRHFLYDLAVSTGKRIVLFFDDAAHIGRERALTEFFDIFRTISSELVSCKAAIYPGVTKFGNRFDVYNDSTVIDIARDERSSEFQDFFTQVVIKRFPVLNASLGKDAPSISAFLGRTVVGNMRAFVFACKYLSEETKYGLPELRNILLKLSSDYYWPLLDEVAPKLGPYQPLIEPCIAVAEELFKLTASSSANSVIIHRDLVQKYAKLFEILEYAGFISRREVSRAMKSGGRGPRYCLNLASLMELMPKSLLTRELHDSWLQSNQDAAEIHVSSNIFTIELPSIEADTDLGIFEMSITSLAKSNAYPYGLTPGKVESLQAAGKITIKDLIDTNDDDLQAIDGIGEQTVNKIRSVINQAIWM